MGRTLITPVAVEFHCMTCPPLSFHTDSLTNVQAHIMLFSEHNVIAVAGVSLPRVTPFRGYRYSKRYIERRRNNEDLG